MESGSSEVTRLLLRWNQGDMAARERLIPVVYEQLRRIARQCLAGRGRDHTLPSAALVNEAYLRLVKNTPIQWNNKLHFFAVAAQLMRRILVDYVRTKHAKKRGGECVTLVLDQSVVPAKEREVNLLALDDALNSLAKVDERQCRLVELRFFAGLSIEETAQVMEISPATVKREWATARLWLIREMSRNHA